MRGATVFMQGYCDLREMVRWLHGVAGCDGAAPRKVDAWKLLRVRVREKVRVRVRARARVRVRVRVRARLTNPEPEPEPKPEPGGRLPAAPPAEGHVRQP